MVGSLPDSLPGMQAQQVLKDNFEVDNTYLVMYDSAMDSDDKSRMVAEIDKLDGVESTLGLRSFVGPSIPENMIPADVREILQNGDYEITLINTKGRFRHRNLYRKRHRCGTLKYRYEGHGLQRPGCGQAL